jgi:RluA family pseudouridine synthase
MGHDHLLKFTYHGPIAPLVVCLKETQLKEYSIKAIRRAIDQKAVKINQQLAMKATQLVEPKSVICIDLSRLQTEEKIEIIAEDEDLLIINKPPFVTSSEEEINKRLKTHYFLCHRIDKETSGLLILAKNKAALQYMENLFYEQKVQKRYLALVYSSQVLKDKFLVNQPLAIAKKTQFQVIMKIDPKGQSAETFFKIAKAKHPYYLLECFPKTGRTHQIRVHLKEIKAPILGDIVYGGKQSSAGRFLLHAESISFAHPKTGEIQVYSAPIPKDFKREIEVIFSK